MNRKPRKDSKLHTLPPDQRGRVDKWLFDKGLTCQQVADACLKLFGLKISKSSVGRYYCEESGRRMINTGLQPGEERPNGSLTASAVSTFGRKPLKRLARGVADDTGLKPGVNESVLSPEERWQELLARMTKRALDLATYLSLEWDDEASREMLTLAKVLISARRERTDGMLARLYRKRFEMWAAKEVYRFYVKTFKRKKKKAFNFQSRKARLRNERFNEDIEQQVEHAIASEKSRQECGRQRPPSYVGGYRVGSSERRD